MTTDDQPVTTGATDGDEPVKCHTARDHARHASDLLNGVSAYSHRLAELTEDERLQVLVSGGFKRHNAQMEFVRDLALAHAQTAVALKVTEEMPSQTHRLVQS